MSGRLRSNLPCGGPASALLLLGAAVGGTIPPIAEHKVALVSQAASELGMPVDRVAVRDYLAAEIEWAKGFAGLT